MSSLPDPLNRLMPHMHAPMEELIAATTLLGFSHSVGEPDVVTLRFLLQTTNGNKETYRITCQLRPVWESVQQATMGFHYHITYPRYGGGGGGGSGQGNTYSVTCKGLTQALACLVPLCEGVEPKER